MEEIDKKMKLKKIFFKKIEGWYAPHNANGGVPPTLPPKSGAQTQSAKITLFLMNKQKKIHHTPYIYTCARARKAMTKKEKSKKPPRHCLSLSSSIKHNIVSRLFCTLSQNLCKILTQYSIFLNSAKWSLQNDR